MAQFCDWRGYFWTVFAYPRAYAAAGSPVEIIKLAVLLWSGSVPFLLVLFAGLAASRQYRWLIVSALVVGFTSCVLPMRAYMHYWENCFPYIALVIGLGLERVDRERRAGAWLCVAALAAALIPLASIHLWDSYTGPSNLALVRVAKAVDRVAPLDANLMVCGPMCCESIQFASRLPAANKFSWVGQLQPPWRDILPQPLESIFADYIAHAPDVIVIDANYLARAMGNPPPETPDYLRLMRALFETHKYKVVDKLEGYIVTVRQKEDSTSDAGKSPPR